MKAFSFLRSFLVFYFLVPYLLFLRFFNLDLHLDGSELIWGFKNSFVQSALPALLVTVLAFFLSRGLFQLSGKFYEVVQKLLLLPQILPSIFSILIAFSIWKPFPLGTVGISFIFTLVYLGFATVFLHAATVEKIGSYGVISEIYGLGRFCFFRKVFFPILKQDLLSCFLMIFVFCFSSFSIPLVAGGGRDTNIEVLVYEKIFINQNWPAAWTIGVLQSLFLTGMSFLLLKQSHAVKQEFSYSNYLRSSGGYVALIIYLSIYLGGYFLGVFQALPELSKLLSFLGDIGYATLSSLKFLTFYIGISLGLLYLWLYDFTQNYRLNFANHFIAASTMLVGFAFYLTFPQSKEWDLIKIPFAMSILVFPVLFKSFLEKSVWDLKDQIITARVFGISPNAILWHVVLRRLQTPLMLWFSFLVIWFLSDFAVLRSMGTQTETLGLMTQSFLSGYRLSLAYLMSVYILIVWVVVLVGVYLLKEVLLVAYKKSKSSF